MDEALGSPRSKAGGAHSWGVLRLLRGQSCGARPSRKPMDRGDGGKRHNRESEKEQVLLQARRRREKGHVNLTAREQSKGESP